jgi:hypothetical protein
MGDDRMWMAADPKLNGLGFDTVFMTYHDISTGAQNIQLSISSDGGLVYGQSTPVINPADVPFGQWSSIGLLGPSTGAGNELGNIVARRSGCTTKLGCGVNPGPLKLYSIFITPDSEADNRSQGIAGTSNLNRVYEAVGTVTDPVVPGQPPTVSWHDYEIYHGPLGARYSRIFPVTAVDDAGKVYAFWSDGNHIDYKTSTDGVTGWNPATAPGQIANPNGVNTAIMPWAEAGTGGVVDLVFYGASGGAGTGANPQDDPNNQWKVYFAQSRDGGASWGVFPATNDVIHTGPICIDGLACDIPGPRRDRTLLDFFQVSIDPTNGAADIAYADDHASKGNAVLYFTRQCTGTSATTGLDLVNDCAAPPAKPTLPQGSTCPGPQIVDFVGDAPNNYPAGDGQNIDTLDIVNTFFLTPDASTLRVTMTVKNLSPPPPPGNMASGLWVVFWKFGTKTYYASATSNGPVFQGSVGTYDGSFHATNSSVPVTTTSGANGTIALAVPRTDVGSPPNGATLTGTSAETHGAFNVPMGGTVYYTAAADRAPDSGFGADYVVGQTCGGTPPPSCTEVHGAGQVDNQQGGRADFTVNEANEPNCNNNNGSGVTTHDAQGGHNFHSTKTLSLGFNPLSGVVTIAGTGLDNGVPVTFTAVAIDKGVPALDVFRLTLSNGYSIGGTLRSGAITLRTITPR